MSELQAQWTAAIKAAQTFCAKNSNSKKAFAKLTKTVDSKLSSCLKAIDKAVEAGDGPGFDKARAKAKPLLEDAQEAYKEGLKQGLYKQNEVRLLFAAVTATKPDSLSGKLRDLVREMRTVERPPSKEDKAAEKAQAKTEKEDEKAQAKEEKRREASRADQEKTLKVVQKVIDADTSSFQAYRQRVQKIIMAANEQNGDLIVAHDAFHKENDGEKKTQAGEDARTAHAACAKLVALIDSTLKKPPTALKSEKVVAKAFPGRRSPREVIPNLDALIKRIEATDRELREIKTMLEDTMRKKTPPASDKQAEKDAKKAAERRKAEAKEAEARKKERAAQAKKREKEEAKEEKAAAKRQEKQQKYQDSENAKDAKLAQAVLKTVSADDAKIEQFVAQVRQFKMQAAGADGDLLEARDAYGDDNSTAGDYAAKREICVRLSEAYKKAHGKMPNCAKSEGALEKAFNGRPPKSVRDAVNGLNHKLDSFGEELENLHIMLDRSLSSIPGPR